MTRRDRNFAISPSVEQLAEMMTPEYGSDICLCGDFRSEHNPLCFCGCSRFQFFSIAAEGDIETWRKYHQKQGGTNDVTNR